MAKKVNSAKEPKRAKHALDARLVSQASPYLFSTNWNYLIIDDRMCQMLVIDSYPNRLDLDWGRSLVGAGGINAQVTISLTRYDAETLRGELSKTVNESQSWDTSNIMESYMDRMEKDYKVEQANDAASLIVRSNARLFQANTYVAVWADDPTEMRAFRNTVNQSVGKHLHLSHLFANQEAMFWGASPFMCADEYSAETNNWSMPATTVAFGNFNVKTGICDPTGVPIGVDKQGGLIRVNLTNITSDITNRNVMITGESGSGKSTLLKHVAVWLRMLYGVREVFIDVDGEVSKMVIEMGGDVLYINNESSLLISPFYPRNIGYVNDTSEDAEEGRIYSADEAASARERALDARVLATHLPFLVEYLLQKFGLDRNEMYDLLYRACEATYVKIGIDKEMTFREYYATPEYYPTLSRLYESVCELIYEYPMFSDSIERLKLCLYRGAYGPEAHIWNGQARVIPDTPILCINLEGLSEDKSAQAAEYYNILSWEWSLVRSKRYSGEHVYLFNDEIATIVNAQNVQASIFLMNISKRIRKYGSAVINSTQFISDIVLGDVAECGQAIIYNSAYQFFGSCAGSANRAAIQELINVPDTVMDELVNARRGRFIFRAGKKEQSWVDVQIPDWELEMFGMGGGQ